MTAEGPAADPSAMPTRIERELEALYEEYRALYGLVEFRMTALDRRAPVTAGALTAAIAAMDVVSRGTQLLILLAAPLALVWFVRATVNHARSFEDVLRRIEEIERAVNDRLGAPVLLFQSRHPSRGRYVGGRTGGESVAAAVATSLLLLAAAACLAHRNGLLPPVGETAYVLAVVGVGFVSLREARRLSRYRYVPAADIVGPGKGQ